MSKKTIPIEIDNELINQTAELLKLSFIKNMNDHGMPKFKDFKSAFRRKKYQTNII
jgi:hypothetical protein